jgi:DNA-binding NarL/FixJ family response regulator
MPVRRYHIDTNRIPTPPMHVQVPDPAESADRLLELSTMELGTLRYLVRGWTPAEIAAHRFVALDTVRSQIKSMHARLAVDTTLRAVALYHQARAGEYDIPR